MTNFVNNSDFKVKDEKEYLFFDRYANEITPKNEKEKIYAKVLVSNGGKVYYIKTYQNSPFDPLGAYAKRESYLETKMSRVSKNTFDFYMMYLKTNNSIYMTKAQRNFIND